MSNKVKMTLIGVDGNAFSLMGAFSSNARKQGWTNDEIKVVTDDDGDWLKLDIYLFYLRIYSITGNETKQRNTI